ncbi:hypothetical protein HD806DRAFT_491127 [Xylariaceae sp. AK1471]|nr:hypothetical protein HD806DRAFT_491127 [Xylariaceae sp. AK1471]
MRCYLVVLVALCASFVGAAPADSMKRQRPSCPVCPIGCRDTNEASDKRVAKKDTSFVSIWPQCPVCPPPCRDKRTEADTSYTKEVNDEH